MSLWQRHLRSGLVLLALLVATTSASGCRSGGSGDDEGGGGEGEATGPGAGPVELVAPAPAAPEAVGARVVQHLENMTLVARPLEEFCDEMGSDLDAYHALARADFAAAAAAAPLGAEDRARIETAYDALAAVSTRCISDARAREFNRALLEGLKPVRQAPSGG